MYRGKVLSIAGSDPSGGAGIQADIKTITVLGCYAACCITSLTAQNTTGVYGIWDVSPEALEQQIYHVLNDIKIDAIKIGMLPHSLIEIVSKSIPEGIPVVLDPVMVSTSRHALVKKESFMEHMKELINKTYLLTPNVEEAELISGQRILNKEDMLDVGKKLAQLYRTNVLLKGGTIAQENYVENILFSEDRTQSFVNKKINKTLHGTGCTLSTAIACFLAQGTSLEESIHAAMEYISNAISLIPKVGTGFNPVFHNYGVIRAGLHKKEDMLGTLGPSD